MEGRNSLRHFDYQIKRRCDPAFPFRHFEILRQGPFRPGPVARRLTGPVPQTFMLDPKKRPKLRDAGLEGSIMCHCLDEGKTKPPPFPIKMIHSVSGWKLDEPWTGHEKQHDQFIEWMKSPCEHPRMRLVTEVFQWKDTAKFRYALLTAGRDYFPAILRAFPENSNAGGSTTVAEALSILEQLKYFHHKAELGWATVLVDTDNGQEIAEYTTDFQGTFLWTRNRELGLDDDGFFVKDTASGKILFRSVKFMQILGN